MICLIGNHCLEATDEGAQLFGQPIAIGQEILGDGDMVKF
jgi:hypothetical protein